MTTDDPKRPQTKAIHRNPVNHVGLNVENLDAAIAFYTGVLGFEVLVGPIELRAVAGAATPPAQIFGEHFRRGRMAHLATGNGVGLELFEFIEPRTVRPAQGREPWRWGFSHLCVTDADVEGLARRIIEAGGQLLTPEPITAVPGYEPREMHLEDPFGHWIEILSHSYERTLSNVVAQPPADADR